MSTEIIITPYMIEQWIGSDNLSVDHFLDLLTEIANGDYPVEVFRDEVISYLADMEEN